MNVTGTGGEKVLSFPVAAQDLVANGEKVSAYIIGDGKLQELTITGTATDMMNALDVGFYASTWQGKRAAMTVSNINVWFPNDNGSLSKISEYSPLSNILKSELKDDITGLGASVLIGLGVPIVLGTISDGIPRDDAGSMSFIYLTKFIDPQSITFNGVLENGSTGLGESLFFLDEAPIYKEIKAETVDALLSQRFSYNNEAPTYQGLLDIVNGNNTDLADAAANILYNKLKETIAGKGDIQMTVDIKVKTYNIDISLQNVFNALIPSPEKLKSMLPNMKFQIKISTCPFKETKAEYGSKASPIKLSEITGDRNPLIFWGLDIYGPDSSVPKQ